MKFDQAYFDAGVNRVGTDCYKWDEMRKETGDDSMIPMWVADMDFQSPPAVQEAIQKIADQKTWGYTFTGPEHVQALCDFWQRRHQVTIRPESVVSSPTVVTGLRLAVRTMTKPGDGVIVMPPVYGPFFASVKENDRVVIESPLIQDEAGYWNPDYTDLEAKMAGGNAKALMLCSPHNPCGKPWKREELEKIVSLCRQYGLGLICDEIHADFVFNQEGHVSILNIEGAREITVMLCAASKTFNVAGLEHSAMVCENEEIRNKITGEMNACGLKAGNCFAMAASKAAYTDCDEWLDGLLVYLKGNYETAVEYIRENMPKIKVTPLEATYLMWLDCRALGLEQEELVRKTLEAHVKLNDGLFFGEQGRGFLRLNLGCPRKQLLAALENLKTVLG